MARVGWITLGAVLVATTVGGVLWSRYHRTTAPGYAAASTETAAALTRQGPAAAYAEAGAPVAGGPVAPEALAFEALKARAKQGDRVAQRRLAQTYERCFQANLRPGQLQRDIAERVKHIDDPEAAANMQRVADERVEECRWVDNGAIVPLELIEGWYLQAGENGDVAAQLTLQMKIFEQPDLAVSKDLLQRVLTSHDPEAVWAMGQLVSGPGLETGNAQDDALFSGEASGYAWMIAACRMGYACEPHGPLMDDVCLGINGCGGEDFETFVRSHLVAGKDTAELDRKVEQISGLLEGR